VTIEETVPLDYWSFEAKSIDKYDPLKTLIGISKCGYESPTIAKVKNCGKEMKIEGRLVEYFWFPTYEKRLESTRIEAQASEFI